MVYLAWEKPVSGLSGKSVLHRRSSCPSEGLTNFTYTSAQSINWLKWNFMVSDKILLFIFTLCLFFALCIFFNPFMLLSSLLFIYHQSEASLATRSCYNQIDEVSLPSLLSSLLCHRLQIKIEDVCIGLASSKAWEIDNEWETITNTE